MDHSFRRISGQVFTHSHFEFRSIVSFSAHPSSGIEGQSNIVFSEEVGKINQAGIYQSRFFVVTAKNIYNFKDRNFQRPQRVIPIMQLDGIVVSSRSKELVLQGAHSS